MLQQKWLISFSFPARFHQFIQIRNTAARIFFSRYKFRMHNIISASTSHSSRLRARLSQAQHSIACSTDLNKFLHLLVRAAITLSRLEYSAEHFSFGKKVGRTQRLGKCNNCNNDHNNCNNDNNNNISNNENIGDEEIKIPVATIL